MDVSATRPTGEAGRRAGVTGNAVAAAGCDVAGIRCGALRTFRAFARIRAVMTGVAAGRAHRRVVHRVADEARCGLGVAIAALDASDRDMRWRRQAQRQCAVVAARAIGVTR